MKTGIEMANILRREACGSLNSGLQEVCRYLQSRKLDYLPKLLSSKDAHIDKDSRSQARTFQMEKQRMLEACIFESKSKRKLDEVHSSTL